MWPEWSEQGRGAIDEPREVAGGPNGVGPGSHDKDFGLNAEWDEESLEGFE